MSNHTSSCDASGHPYDRCGSVTEVRVVITTFIEGYDDSHPHADPELNTPTKVQNTAEDRSAVLGKARLSTPERFATSTDPKILALSR